MKRPPEINFVIGIGIFAIVAMIAYWSAWFLAPSVVQARTAADADFAIYTGYQLAFPLPDVFVTLACIVGVIGLWTMQDYGFFAMMMAGGGALFLGLEDLLYDIEHSMFTPFSGAAAIELAIVLVILSLGPAMTSLLWRRRRDFFR